MNERCYLIISGYNGSGASALIDMLLEYDSFYYTESEMRLICDPYGIKELERKLTDDWDWVNASAAILDFLNLAKVCGRTGGGRNPFARPGLGYNKTISKEFLKITKDYVKEITDFRYYGDFYYQKFKMNHFEYIIKRLRYGIEAYTKGKLATANRETVNYFSAPSKEQFLQATRKYFDRLHDNINVAEYPYIILDLALSPRDGLKIYDYFSKAKMIIVDRDPRDILADHIRIGWYRREWGHENAGKNFAKWQSTMREGLVHDTNILYVNFEDIILRTTEVRKKVFDFLELDYTEPQHPRTHLFVEKSANNIGLWKKYYGNYKKTFDVVAEELSEYLIKDCEGLN